MTELMSTDTEIPMLAELTTLHVGGLPDAYVETTTEQQLIDTIQAADAAEQPVLVIGGGSNLLISDAGFHGVVVRDLRQGIEIEGEDSCGGAAVNVLGGHTWDDLVRTAVESGWIGIEALSGIPGTVGAAPVQNIGAYGQEVSGVISTVRTWDRIRNRVRTFSVGELNFGYRTSVLKESMRSSSGVAGAPWYPTPAYVVLSVSFQFRLGTLSAPIAYPELARRLEIEVGERAESTAVRNIVLQLRAKKGMLASGVGVDGEDAESADTAIDYDRWSAGSFFTNPIVPAELADQLPPGAPRYPVRSSSPAVSTGPSLGAIDPDWIKTSAAWLIEQAGFGKGYSLVPGGLASLSTKHTLALTNRGSAEAADIAELARAVRQGVLDKFGIVLEPEPTLVGISL